jgi:hypothetical protein
LQNILIGFLDFVKSFLNTVLPNLNSGGTQNISDAVKYMITFISAANYLFPVTTLFTVIGIVMAYKIFMMALWVVNKVIKLIRG